MAQARLASEGHMMIDSTLSAERDRLEHQRSRIEEILASRIVSDELDRELRLRLGHISLRIEELSATAGMMAMQHHQPPA